MYRWPRISFAIAGRCFSAYAPLLGEAGRAHYRRRVEAAWRRLPALKATAREAVAEGRGRRVLQSEMVRFAQANGDVDALVAVHQKDLSTPDGYTAITRAYRDVGRHDEALSWAEQGWNAFNDRYDAACSALWSPHVASDSGSACP